jgi:tRNA dimethylallyltransferase
MNTKPTVLCIVGPTACGKTALSVEAAIALKGEIVSADAVAVYRGLDIGSAKPNVSERKGVPHHLIDCAEITDDSFTVSTFRSLARDAIDGIHSGGKLPIVVGGSGLYLDAVFADMRFSAPSDAAIRTEIETEYDRDRSGVFETLRRIDPVTADRLHPNDKKRVVRALEVYRVSGKTFSECNDAFISAQRGDHTYRTVRIGLNTDRKVLYDRIDRRVDRMIEDGLLDEAFRLFGQGLTPDRFRAMQSIGYAELYDVYRGIESKESAIERIKRNTRHFAKRQITWFKRNPDTVWFDPLKTPGEEIIGRITEYINGHTEND